MAGLRKRLERLAERSPRGERLHRVYLWFRPPRQLRTTTLGKLVLGFTIVIGVAATNTGNNLLYLILGGLFGLVAASGVLSERVLKRLEARLELPEFLIANRAGVCTAELRSRKGVDSYLLWGELLDTDEEVLDRVFIQDLPAGGRRHLGWNLRVARRGPLAIGGVRLRTRFPFHMYEKSRILETPATLWVAPEPVPVRLPAQLHSGQTSGHQRRGRQEGAEFIGLRERLPSDPVSRIHWKRSATVGKHMVKVFAAERSPVLVMRLAAGVDDEAFENGLRRAAGLLDAARRQGVPVRLEAGARRVWDRDGRSGWRRAMLALAQADRSELPAGGDPLAVAVER